MRPQLNPILLGVGAPWSAPGSSLDLQFTTGRAAVNRQKASISSLLTTTRASTGYASTSTGSLTLFPANTPRITDLGLLVEQAATNLALQSQTFTNATWAKNSASVSGTTTAPDGTNTALKLVEAAATNTHLVNQTISVSNGTSYSTSIYFKPAERTWAYIQWNDLAGGFPRAWINLSTGALGTVQAGLTATVTAAANGFYRLNVVGNSNGAAPGSAVISFGATTGDGVVSYAGDGASGIYLWQADLVALGFPTSPIATTTVSVTRAADSIQWVGSALPILRSATGWCRAAFPFGSKVVSSSVSLVSRQLSPDDAFFVPNATTGIRALANSSGASTATIGSSGTWAGRVVGGVTWDSTGISICGNAGTVNAGATPFTANPTDPIYLGSSDGATAGAFINNFIERVTFGTGAKLTSAQVQALAQ